MQQQAHQAHRLIAKRSPAALTLTMTIRALAMLLSLIVISTPLSAASADSELLTINMRDADISAVIQWVAEQTNKKIVVDPRVKGKVTVLANGPMTKEQAYEVFLTMLDVYGYGASESGGILRIFPAAMSRSSPTTVIDDFGDLQTSAQALYVYTASNVSATKLSQLLKPLLATSGYIVAYPDSNSLIIAEEASNIKRLVSLIRQIDESGDLDIEVIKLQHASSEDVAGLVESLVKGDNSLAFSIASDKRSNSVMMSGDPSTRDRVRRLVQQLDQPISEGGNTRVVYLHYLDAKELLPILRGMSSAVIKDSKDAQAAASTISIESSESSNAIIMTAPPALLDVMSDVIAQVDIRRAQVLVEAIIVEVSKDFSETIGVQWSTSLNGTGTEALTNFGITPIDLDVEDLILPGQGLSLGFFRNGSLRVLAQAIANEKDANILSTPSILTLDNQEAEILVGSNVPFITGQSTGSASTTSDPFTTIERKDIGLTLKITPQINEGDAVTLDILQEIETITASTLVTNDIVTDKRSIKTKVLVEDGTILVLGGLVSDETSVIESKVPFLGDLPLIGQLFKTTTEQTIKKNLMVFIHPVIIDSDVVAENVTRKNYNLMRELQKKYSTGQFALKRNDLSDFTEYKPKKTTENKEKEDAEPQ